MERERQTEAWQKERDREDENDWRGNGEKRTAAVEDLKWETRAENRIYILGLQSKPQNDVVLVIKRGKIKKLLPRVEPGLNIGARVSLPLGYQELCWNNLYKLLFNIFRFGSVGSVYYNFPPKTEPKFSVFYIIKPKPNRTETKLKFLHRFGRFEAVFSVRRFFAHPYR